MSCQYLNSVLMEVLRIAPPGPGTMWRETEAHNTPVDGHLLPQGIDVGVCIFTLHTLPSVFRDPHLFWPERWMPNVLPQSELQRARLHWKPFSGGPRSCIGQSLAMMELRVTIAKTMLSCEFGPPKGPLGKVGEGSTAGSYGRQNAMNFQFETRFTSVTRGPWLQFRRLCSRRADDNFE